MPADKPKDAEGNDEKHHIVNKAENEIATGLSPVSTIERAPTTSTGPATAEFLTEKSKAPLCRQLASYVGTPGCDYSYNRNGLLSFEAHIYGAVQKCIPRSIPAHILHAYHYLPLAGHSTERSMYGSMRCKVYWPDVANDLYRTGTDCRQCACNRATKT